MKRFISILMGLAAGSLCALLVIPVATAQRGYNAVGGEWLLIMFVVYIAYKMTRRKIA